MTISGREERYGNALEAAMEDAYAAAREFADQPEIAARFRRIGDTCDTALEESGTIADLPLARLTATGEPVMITGRACGKSEPPTRFGYLWNVFRELFGRREA